MLRLTDILAKVHSYHPDADIDLIKRAYVFSAKVHQGQVRKSGEPYLVHPLEVCGLLADMRLDEHTLSAGILHDTIEDTVATAEDLKQLFGPQVSEIVEGVTKLSTIPYSTSHERAAENFRRMVVAMAKDIRVILVKLADRLHNMRTLEHMRPEKQEQIAQETLDIYAPLANRLGIHWMKAELEDACLKYLHPKDAQSLSEQLEATEKARQGYIEEVKALLSQKMAENGVPAEVQGRVKHLYSIWRKLKAQGIEFEQVNDIVAFRVLTDSIPHCYEAFGYVHAMWRPVPGRFKDFVATPKPNGYQSLHTTVLGPGGQRVEIQIRTREMHEVAEQGIAAHWAYKEGKPKAAKDGQQFAWLRQLMDWQRELQDPTEFISSVKFDLFGDEVYVFTPKGEVKELTSGSTPVDFAYAIHTEVGNHCAGAKVNGRMVPLRYRLKNGDTVEIITNTNQHPNKDWLAFVKTARARNRINYYLRQEQRKRAVQLGEEILERELKRFGRSLQKTLKSKPFDQLLQSSKQYHRGEDVLAAIGYGKLTASIVLRKLLSEDEIAKGPREEPKSRLGQLFQAVARKSTSGITVQGLDDVLVRFAKCCNAVPGDPIVGFVSRGRGVTVHNMQCQKALNQDPERKVPVTWDSKSSVERAVQLRVITDDRPGILATISQAFTGAGANILNANCRARKDRRAINTFTVAVRDATQLRTIMKDIEGLSGIHSVERLQV
ncbi:MAG: bifunctional (p)ppGpp synthetase/guanosine-3',5'-bis(diphosphate) 3'-pyrophosphohydrolase [Deltaproteobacteria bacterium]|nr:bifunctional (p)ppGpp synthetase/guanosine-3',5'-bis(diphosphate) 3'-pyrophosphohydrolase [Deltaproteobacteria bacterium]